MTGYGAALTESSAWLFSQLSATQRDAALRLLFDPVTGAGFSYVRLPLGASDFSLSAYTYDDLPAGKTDPTLTQFTVAHDDAVIVPVLQQILSINPNVRIIAAPWTAPAWMKDSGSLYGGSLKPMYYGTYAQYLVKAVQSYAARGISLDALTVQNEPLNNDTSYPTMTLSAAQEAALIGSYVGPAFAQAQLTTKIVGLDHNWDDSSYASSMLSDTTAAPYVSGTAWHCYGGDVSAMTSIHNAFPTKATYFTECSGGDWATDFASNLGWNAHNIVLGAVHNWAQTAMLWNLALDPNDGPHLGGCANCRGVITVDPTTGSVRTNVEYDILGQATKVVQPKAVRIASPWDLSGLETTAFVNPDGSHAIVVYNSGSSNRLVTVSGTGTTFTTNVPAGAVASYRW